MNKYFIPVKITDKKWADKLVNGEVYMRALHEFGSWGNVTEKDTVLNNNYRGDFFAGVTATYRTADDSDFFRGFPAEVKAHMANCCLVDESDVQFFKIFSLYRHELDEEKQEFVAPDPRMAQFGNTAVLITDFCEFIERYGKAMFAAYDKVISMIGIVEPFNFRETRYLNPLFCKHESQAYQKELRMAFGELKKDFFAIGPGAEDALELIRSLEPVKLQLGDLSDITVEMPIEDFMRGFLPTGFRCRWPSNEDSENPSNYDGIVEWTAEQMKNYRSIFVRPTFAIY